MEAERLHQLSAAYALDALDADEAAEFEAHLRQCPRCREDLAQFREGTAVLAYGTPPAAPRPELRARILESARAENRNVVPFPRPAWHGRALAIASAVAAAAAIAFAVWSVALRRDLDRERSANGRTERALALLAAPDTTRVPLSGATGSLGVAPSGDAVLVVGGLLPAPSGRTYEAWVIRGKKPAPAGTFHGGTDGVLELARRVPRGAQVAVTVERVGGASQPTTSPLFSARVA